MSKLLRTFLIGIALLAMGAEALPAEHNVDCTGCVDTVDIAADAITSGKIANNAVRTGHIKKGAVRTSDIAKRAVTTGKIRDGAVTLAKVAPELSNAIGMFCLPDETVVGMETDGTFACEVPQTLDGDESFNTRAGTNALGSNTSGSYNTASGHFALFSNTSGVGNTASGAFALLHNTIGSSNTASGDRALVDNTEGRLNTASGGRALRNNTTGNSNTAIGEHALRHNTTGDGNIALGAGAGDGLIAGDNNIFISSSSGGTTESGTIRIGSVQTRAFISGIHTVTTGNADALTTLVDSNGQLGTLSSSRRYKEEIHDMDAASERLLSLRPVTFRYKKDFEDGEKPIQFGLIAEEVADVFPELVVYNEDGTPETVKYRLLSTLLLNEFQKQGVELRDHRIELQALTERLEQLENAKPVSVASIQ